MTFWQKLPPELRNMIVHMVVETHCERTDPKSRAGYAIVSWEWNCIVEKRNFRRISLNHDRAQDFEKIFSDIKRRGYLQHLQVLFVLEEYDCDACKVPEDNATRKR